MGFNMIFVMVNEEKTTLRQIALGLKKIDPKYRFESGEYFIYDNELYGQVEINRVGHSYLRDDIKRFQAMVMERSEHANAARILSILERVTAEFFVKVIWEDREDADTLEKFEPLWDWFFANREGILYVDAEGFYDKDGVLLSFAEEESQ